MGSLVVGNYGFTDHAPWQRRQPTQQNAVEILVLLHNSIRRVTYKLDAGLMIEYGRFLIIGNAHFQLNSVFQSGFDISRVVSPLLEFDNRLNAYQGGSSTTFPLERERLKP